MYKLVSKRYVVFLSFLFYSILSFGQCSMCKATAENGSEELAEGLNSGILYLMILPYVLAGGIVAAILITLSRRKKKRIKS